ncbi:MAG: 6-phosphofructokinase [Chloroflexi bacterium]|nr:6-phosphofructokinase [Chloroflexota bacterium]
MQRIGVLTSGGDAPGMNAAIRAVTRTGLASGFEVYGVPRGYYGLIEGTFTPLGARDVGGIIQRGGTMLMTARCPEFRTPEGQRQALQSLAAARIDGLIVIGGGGSMAGAATLGDQGFPVVGLPASIDNDLHGTDMAVGADTALNTALDAIDRIKDTATSHNRAFIIEVMGRNSGFLALMAGVAGGAEVIAVPEIPFDPQTVIDAIREARRKGKPHFIVVVAEGSRWNGRELGDFLQQHAPADRFETRLTILGHVQRGGSPTAFDRLLATRLGIAAVEHLQAGRSGVMVGLRGNVIGATPLVEVINTCRSVDRQFYEVARILAL